jgi:signal transduction histidine kinase
MGVGAFVIALIILAVLFFVNRNLKNLRALIYGMKWVSLGNYVDRAPVLSKDEFGQLAEGFNSMLDKIESSQAEIKRSEDHLRKDATELEKTLKEREEEKAFLEQSKRAIQNLLEDAEETKEDLATESARLQTILSSIGDGLIIIDGRYRVELINPKATELLAIEGINLMGADLRTVMKILKKKKGELPLAEWPTEEVFVTKQVVITDLDDELSIVTEKRTEGLPVAFSIAPLAGEGVVGAVIIIRDVTEDRALDDAKSGFISVASHQLRTPLTTIRWYSEMLLSEDVGTVSGPQRDFLEEIHGGAERLYQTIDLLLGISRVESGKIKSEPVPIDLALFSEEIAHELAPQAQEKKLSLKILPPESQVVVMLDMLTLRQVILNLFSNAIRYTNENGIIEARWSVSEDGKEVTYSVRDNGIGIPETQKSRVFLKFFRAENALEKVPDGSGLGLTLVKDLVEAWGGKVWFDSALGQGTTFLFTVPLEGKTREH